MPRPSPALAILCALVLGLTAATPAFAQQPCDVCQPCETGVPSPEPGTGPAQAWLPPGYSSPRPGYGCGLGYYLHPVQLQDDTLTDRIRSIPCWKRDQVHIFVINGIDIFYWSNLNGVAEYLHYAGFCHVTCVQMTEAAGLRAKIKAIQSCDADARIVIIGFSGGTLCARALAGDLDKDGVFIDRLIYIGSDLIGDHPSSCPDNVGRIVNIMGHGFLFLGYDLFCNGTELPCAMNIRLDARHMCLPTQCATVETIVLELCAVSERIPVSSPLAPAPAGALPQGAPATSPAVTPTLPAPRPLDARPMPPADAFSAR